jgi:hypothetical protein
MDRLLELAGQPNAGLVLTVSAGTLVVVLIAWLAWLKRPPRS